MAFSRKEAGGVRGVRCLHEHQEDVLRLTKNIAYQLANDVGIYTIKP